MALPIGDPAVPLHTFRAPRNFVASAGGNITDIHHRLGHDRVNVG
jgi:hypothetical protein